MRAGLGIAGAVLALDQIVKYWVLHIFDLPARGQVEILPFFSLTMIWNEGVSLGLLQAGPGVGRWLLVALTSLIAIWIVFWLRRVRHWLSVLGLGLVLGGAVGNILDRVIYGAVADFVHLHAGGHDFYVFNLADGAITLGVGALIAEAVWGGGGSRGGPSDAAKPETVKPDAAKNEGDRG
ncbi:MAG: signal peptidase II [Alphaproteobacteria bacterium]|nr:MAG: signal peptidase II [Alphaproteobacteria bacterium]